MSQGCRDLLRPAPQGVQGLWFLQALQRVGQGRPVPRVRTAGAHPPCLLYAWWPLLHVHRWRRSIRGDTKDEKGEKGKERNAGCKSFSATSARLQTPYSLRPAPAAPLPDPTLVHFSSKRWCTMSFPRHQYHFGQVSASTSLTSLTTLLSWWHVLAAAFSCISTCGEVQLPLQVDVV